MMFMSELIIDFHWDTLCILRINDPTWHWLHLDHEPQRQKSAVISQRTRRYGNSSGSELIDIDASILLLILVNVFCLSGPGKGLWKWWRLGHSSAAVIQTSGRRLASSWHSHGISVSSFQVLLVCRFFNFFFTCSFTYSYLRVTCKVLFNEITMFLLLGVY